MATTQYILSLGNLSGGRVGIVTMATANLHSAVVIGVRYSAARRQFGPETGTGGELPVLEYETQRCRIFPYLAAAFALHNFGNSLGNNMEEFTIARMSKEGWWSQFTLSILRPKSWVQSLSLGSPIAESYSTQM